MKVESFELTDDMNPADIPDWVKECLDHQDEMQTIEFPLLIEELIKYKIFSSKSEARNMLNNRGISVFCYEGTGPMYVLDGENYKTIDGNPVTSFNDKNAVVSVPNIRRQFVHGDVVKIGKRKFIKMV